MEIMPPTPDPPFDPQTQGISLDELAEAFAQVMAPQPRRSTDSPAGPQDVDGSARVAAAEPVTAAESAVDKPAPPQPGEDDSCPVSPRTILEAMLFVGDRDSQPLSPRRAAELMRDVEAGKSRPDRRVEPSLRRHRAAYHIIGEGDGYRLTLRGEFHALRRGFFGRIARPACRRRPSTCWRWWPTSSRSPPKNSAACAASPAATSSPTWSAANCCGSSGRTPSGAHLPLPHHRSLPEVL